MGVSGVSQSCQNTHQRLPAARRIAPWRSEQTKHWSISMRVGMDHKLGGALDDDIDKYAEKDLANHKDMGTPYNIIKDEVVGRHMVATRNIKAGDTIMEDIPLTFGPVCSTGIKPMCLGCYRPVDGSVLCEANAATSPTTGTRSASCSRRMDSGWTPPSSIIRRLSLR